MRPDIPPASRQSSVLVVHRPGALAVGAARRFHVFLDDQHVADLARGDTIRVCSDPGPHMLRARCPPMTSGSAPFILEPDKVLHAHIYVTAFDHLHIDLTNDEQRQQEE